MSSADGCIEHHQHAPRYGSGRYLGQVGGLHRIEYCKEHGLTLEDLKGKVLLHTCDNPRCIRVSHLVMGTQAENMADMASKGRSVGGEKHHNAAFTVAVVAAVRDAQGTQREIAREFNMSQSNVSRIRSGKAWEAAR